MTQTATEPLTSAGDDEDDGPDICHVTCCEDEDIAICGADVESARCYMTSADLPPNIVMCQPCVETERCAADRVCPVRALRDLHSPS